jgi:hypothetical protein
MEAELLASVKHDMSYQREEVEALKGKTGLQYSDDDLWDRLHIFEHDIDPNFYGDVYDERRYDRYSLQTRLGYIRDLNRASQFLPTWRSTASFGVTEITSRTKTIPLEIHIVRADQALRRAKNGGRNSVYDSRGDIVARVRGTG